MLSHSSIEDVRASCPEFRDCFGSSRFGLMRDRGEIWPVPVKMFIERFRSPDPVKTKKGEYTFGNRPPQDQIIRKDYTYSSGRMTKYELILYSQSLLNTHSG